MAFLGQTMAGQREMLIFQPEIGNGTTANATVMSLLIHLIVNQVPGAAMGAMRGRQHRTIHGQTTGLLVGPWRIGMGQIRTIGGGGMSLGTTYGMERTVDGVRKATTMRRPKPETNLDVNGVIPSP